MATETQEVTGRTERHDRVGGEPDQLYYEKRQRIGLIAGIVAIIGLLLLPAPADMDPAAWRTAAVGVLMGIWWMTEAIPIPATSLLPLALFPLLGIGSIQEAATPYANPLIFLFMGGFMIALAMERWNLHRRIALATILRVGTRPDRIVMGFMIATAFLSLWVSNTATAMMMLPIGLSVVDLVRVPGVASERTNFAVVLMLTIAYASSIGGVGTLIGTPTNAFLAGFMLETYGVELDMVAWMLFAIPLVIVGLVLTFLLLTRVIYPIRIREIPGGRAFIEEQYRSLGAMRRPERMVGFVFAMTAMLWVFRPLLSDVLPGLSDTGIAMFGAVILFLLPVDWKRGDFVLNWTWARRLPWGVLLLFGGGLSFAAAVSRTGLAEWIGASLSGIGSWPLVLILLLVTGIIILLTELTSNTATAAAFLPVLAALAVSIEQDPFVLVIPATLAASCAFMLPVATPPNAIVYGSSFISIPQMARAGLYLNALFLILITLLARTLLPLVLGL